MNKHNRHNRHNRHYKDSVFADLFGRDSSAKANFLSLYNALHGTNLSLETTELKPLRLRQVLYRNFYNDVSFLVDGRIVVLVEHQSTINENMPLRFLLYVARLYEKLTETKSRYLSKLLTIPSPEFYVFYNGTADYPTQKILRLSDAFASKTESPPLELTATVYNINHGKHAEILDKCKPLDEFSSFVETVRQSLGANPENGFVEAVKTCIKQGVLLDYLQRNNTEVVNMLLAEYDYDLDMQVKAQEAREEGLKQGLEYGRSEGERQKALETAKNALAAGIEPETAALITGLSLEEVEQVTSSK